MPLWINLSWMIPQGEVPALHLILTRLHQCKSYGTLNILPKTVCGWGESAGFLEALRKDLSFVSVFVRQRPRCWYSRWILYAMSAFSFKLSRQANCCIASVRAFKRRINSPLRYSIKSLQSFFRFLSLDRVQLSRSYWNRILHSMN